MSSITELIDSGVPAGFFKTPRIRNEWPNPKVIYRYPRVKRPPVITPTDAAFARGRTDGLRNRHHMPELRFDTPQEWLAHRDGWREGQRERAERIAQRRAA